MEMKRIFSKVFMWMFVGLMITAISSFVVINNPNIFANIFNTGTYLILIILEIGLVIFLSARIHKMSFITSATSFILYSVVSGATLASILIAYPVADIIMVFGLTSIIFFIFGLIGFLTKIDLSKFSSLLLMMLIGVIITSLVNMFIGNGVLEMVISAVAILVFLGLTAHDIQRIKMMAGNVENENQVAIYGALQIYLDFINIFIRLLSIFGRES